MLRTASFFLQDIAPLIGKTKTTSKPKYYLIKKLTNAINNEGRFQFTFNS